METPASHPLETLVEDLMSSTGLLLRRLRAEGNPDELSWSQTAALGRLARSGPATTADLARAEGIKPQSMGATMAALERERLVTRTPHPSDGRQALYDLTPLGHETRARQRLVKRAWLAAAMATLDAEEQASLSVALTTIRKLAAA
jgi:DNA-binding MarR family transcriptional regulator